MNVASFFSSGTSSADALASSVLGWLGLSLLYGTILAGITWLLMRTALRRTRLAIAGLIWSVVLLKFVMPVGPAVPYSLATLVESAKSVFAAPAPPAVESADPELVEFITIFERDGVTPGETLALTPVAAPPSWPLIVVGLYAICILAITSIRFHQFYRICRKCGSLPRAGAELIAVVDDACRRVGLTRRPDVRLSDVAPAPFVVGVLRPTLVLSHRHLSDQAETEAVILHELGHLRPVDLLLRCLQCLVGTLLFFWPVVAWVNRRIDLAREHACDDWALSHGRLSSSEYARCLLRALQPVRSTWSLYQPAAMAANPRHVERRIEMILDHPRQSNHARTFGVGALLVVAAWGVFALSGSTPVDAAIAPADDATQPSKDGAKKIVVTRVHDDADGQVDVQVVRLEDGKMKVTVNGKEQTVDAPSTGGVMTQVGGAKAMAFVTRSNVTTAGDGPIIWQQCDTNLADFLTAHPAADINADGTLEPEERSAYLAALATTAPAQVLAQFPESDLNSDGLLDLNEAARLVSGPTFDIKIAGETPHAMAFAAGPAGPARIAVRGVPADAKAKAVFVATEDADGNAVEPKVVELKVNCDVVTSDDASEPGQNVFVVKVDGKDNAVAQAGGNVSLKVAPIDGGTIHKFSTAWVGAPHHGAGQWLAENVAGTPTLVQLNNALVAVREAPLAQFLEMHPEADTNLDGRLTVEEQKAFLDSEMARVRVKILERHPAADANADGVLSEAEMHEYFKSKAMGHFEFAPGAEIDGQHDVMFIGPPADPQVIEIELVEDPC